MKTKSLAVSWLGVAFLVAAFRGGGCGGGQRLRQPEQRRGPRPKRRSKWLLRQLEQTSLARKTWSKTISCDGSCYKPVKVVNRNRPSPFLV